MPRREARLTQRLFIPAGAEWTEVCAATHRAKILRDLRTELPRMFTMKSAKLDFRVTPRTDGVFLVVYAIDCSQLEIDFSGPRVDLFQMEVRMVLADIKEYGCQSALAVAPTWTADQLRDDANAAIRLVRLNNRRRPRLRAPHLGAAVWQLTPMRHALAQATVVTITANVTAWFPSRWLELGNIQLQGEIPEALINASFSKRFLMKLPAWTYEVEGEPGDLLAALEGLHKIFARVGIVFDSATGKPKYCELIELLQSDFVGGYV